MLRAFDYLVEERGRASRKARTNIVDRRGARTPRDAEKISAGSLSVTLRLGVSAVKINEGASYPRDALLTIAACASTLISP
jgi:hypothetical protein